VADLCLVQKTDKAMIINTKAPLQFRHDILINAAPEAVWAVLADMERWPNWNRDVTYLTLKGGLQSGTEFVWKEKGAKPTSHLRSVIPNHQLGWTGRAIGMEAVHIFTLEPHEGGTLVVQEESLEGWLVTLLKPLVRRIGNEGIAHWNAALKTRVEGNTTASPRP
jgi:hypothetical protein